MRHGMTEPVLPGSGAVTDVVIGKRTPSTSELDDVDVLGVNVVVCPFGIVIGVGLVIPGGTVKMPPSFEMIV